MSAARCQASEELEHPASVALIFAISICSVGGDQLDSLRKFKSLTLSLDYRSDLNYKINRLY